MKQATTTCYHGRGHAANRDGDPACGVATCDVSVSVSTTVIQTFGTFLLYRMLVSAAAAAANDDDRRLLF